MKKCSSPGITSSNPRIPRSATLATKGSIGSYMRKFVRVYPDRFAESKRRSDLLRQTDGQSKLTPDRFAKDERRSNGNRVLRKFMRLLSVRADNRLQRKPEGASCRLLPTIVRSTDESHQCAERPNAPFQNYLFIPSFQAIIVISILFCRCHTPMILLTS